MKIAVPFPMGQVERLPLWRNVVDEMRAGGIEHGMVFPTEWFEERLRCERDAMAFGLAMSQIRRELEEDGYYLTGRGQKGEQFVILPPEANRAVMRSYERAALNKLGRAVTLGAATRTELMTEADRRRHEAEMERISKRLALMSRERLRAPDVPALKGGVA